MCFSALLYLVEVVLYERIRKTQLDSGSQPAKPMKEGAVSTSKSYGGRLFARLAGLAAACVLMTSCMQSRDVVSVSPSGNFRAFLSATPCSGGWRVWVVNIAPEGRQGDGLREIMPDHPASLMAYLAWDENERLWWCSSDDGSIFFWELSEEGWVRRDYRSMPAGSLVPPEELSVGGNRRRDNR